MDESKGSLGSAILDDLRTNLSRDDVAGYLADFGSLAGADPATQKLTSATGGQVDLRLADHRIAVIGWLRSWGVRHLRRSDTQKTAEALRIWWDAWADRLPGERETLNGLGEAELAVAGQAYDALRASPAAARSASSREIEVTFGDTATSKLLFAVRPRVFVPWDAQMRAALGWPAGGGPAYARLLKLSAAALDGLARRLAVPVSDLPGSLAGPGQRHPRSLTSSCWSGSSPSAQRRRPEYSPGSTAPLNPGITTRRTVPAGVTRGGRFEYAGFRHAGGGWREIPPGLQEAAMPALTRFVLRHKALVALLWVAVAALGVMTISGTTHRMTSKWLPAPLARLLHINTTASPATTQPARHARADPERVPALTTAR